MNVPDANYDEAGQAMAEIITGQGACSEEVWQAAGKVLADSEILKHIRHNQLIMCE